MEEDEMEVDSLPLDLTAASRIHGESLMAYACSLLRITYKHKGEIN